MAFRYFAYGSNLWAPHLRSRCPSARIMGKGVLEGWTAVYDKPSLDGSAKLNIRPDGQGYVEGVIYEIEDGERQRLDEAEPLYTPLKVEVDGLEALVYVYEGEPFAALPYDWYVAVAVTGARSHGLDSGHLESDSCRDPLAPGLRPATEMDLPVIQAILSDGLTGGKPRYYIHPGDYGWWIYHDDPRHPDHFSTWIQDDTGFVTIDSISPHEINVFTRPGEDRLPLIRWAQRRLDGLGEVGWISDDDVEMVTALRAGGYHPSYAFRAYQWDLGERLPPVEPPPGFELRSVAGEHEADNRRAASHAAFESTMDPDMHLQRYLGLMRSPVYSAERDLVAVAPDGTIACFMIWWADPSGVAQIEPFGTHPDFHRQGVGRALLYHGLNEMRRAGMRVARVCTDDDRPATGFYEGIGFRDVGRLRWWKPVP